MYARIDNDGNVIEFPVLDSTLQFPNQTIPSDIVEVDVETNKPQTTWNKILKYDNIENVGGSYILSYIIEDRFSNIEDKKKFIKNLIKQYSDQNEKTFKYLSENINSPYRQEEINTWTLQVTEANNYLNGAGEYPFISKLAEKRNISISDLVNKIIEKHNTYINNYSEILGKYQKNRELLSTIDLNDELTFDLIDQYGW